MSTAPEPWLTRQEIARHLQVSEDTLMRWVQDRAMPAHKLGRQWRFKASEVDAWVVAGGATDQVDGEVADG